MQGGVTLVDGLVDQTLPHKACAPASSTLPNPAQCNNPIPPPSSTIHHHPPPPYIAKTVNGDGAIHLCELVACRLPPERWWEQGKQQQGQGGNGGGRGPQRGKSLKSRL